MTDKQETINLSILDFKLKDIGAVFNVNLAINLSILDFK